jgi:hypothetical protein
MTTLILATPLIIILMCMCMMRLRPRKAYVKIFRKK